MIKRNKKVISLLLKTSGIKIFVKQVNVRSNHPIISRLSKKYLTKPITRNPLHEKLMLSYNTSEFRQGLKKQVDDVSLDFFDKALIELDELMIKASSNVTLEKVSEKDLTVNGVCINNNHFALNKTCWNRLFKDLIRDQSENKHHKPNRLDSYVLFEEMFNNFLEKFLAGDYNPSFMVSCYEVTQIKPIDQSFYDLVYGTLNLLKHSTSNYDHLYGPLRDSKGILASGESRSNLIFRKYLLTNLRSTLNSNISTCYKQFNNQDLPEHDTAKSLLNKHDLAHGIKIPYSSLINWLGPMLISNIFIILGKPEEYFLNAETNPSIYEWIKEPNLKDPMKLLSLTLPVGVLSELGFSQKNLKLIITYLCLQFYNAYDSNPKLGSDVFNMLKQYMAPNLSSMQTYVTRGILKVGATLVSLFTYAGLFAGSLLVGNSLISLQTPIKRTRVVIMNCNFTCLFVKGENLCRPYLVEANKFTGSYNKNTPEYLYWKQVNTKVHINKNSSCEIKDIYKEVLFLDQKFLIDQEALLRLIGIISSASRSNLRLDNYYESKFIQLFSLYDITQKNLRALHNNESELIIEKLLCFLIDFREEPKVTGTQLIKFVKQSSMQDKSFLFELANKVIGIKYSLKTLIYDAILYSQFNFFIQPTYLDTRGRKYFLNASLNIQASTFIRTIVKLPNVPLEDSLSEKELQTIVNIIGNYVNSLTYVSFESIREAWKNKYDFTTNSNYTITNLTSLEYQFRLNHLCTFFKGDLNILDSLKEIHFELNDTLIEIIYNSLNKKKSLIQVIDLIASLRSYNYPPKYRKRKYPIEYDATASGIQMTAYLLRSTSLARWSNLILNTEPYDLYTTAANMFKHAVDQLSDVALLDVGQQLPEHLLWLINKRKLKETDRELVVRFNQTLITLKHIIKKYPELKDLYSKREPWKKSIMTYGYNSSTQGRSDANTMFLRNNLSNPIDKTTLLFLGVIMEKYFKRMIQPVLIGDTTKIKRISSILASTLKPDKDYNYMSRSVTFNNKFLIHRINPPLFREQRFSTNSYKKGIRGYRINYTMPMYDKSGKLCLNIRKATQLIGPNLAHFNDAGVVHEQTLHFNKINELIKQQTNINYSFDVATIHDCYIYPNILFARASIALSYQTYFDGDPINILKDNPMFKEVLTIRDFTTDNNANSIFNIIELDDKFIK